MSPIISPGGGGGGAQPVFAKYDGDPVTIANGASGQLTWDRLDGGTELLDRSVPASPTFLADGLYLIATSAATDSLTNPDKLSVQNVGGGPAGFGQTFSFGGTNYFGATAVSFYQATAGDIATVNVRNDDGSSRDVSLGSAQIVKLT